MEFYRIKEFPSLLCDDHLHLLYWGNAFNFGFLEVVFVIPEIYSVVGYMTLFIRVSGLNIIIESLNIIF